ncbi:hypothetical protein K450DRAFT_280976 [Umbelopsis ramanniana AG]|uniref:DH domain-containing protein n=1 Tax=Umbelopsis ramanniana AG TaxID=1314678 RepID=A0AAD5E910_UMBRA|nr:uncharacterized protein K450DRAFT_280976 [Umbelopsis ramanniana AG]KAI8579353.1 hypothetical protein K450DRAFT_280976 [Umbelopsis ramanniana AG]
MDVLSDINSSHVLVPELEKAASRRAYANFQYSWSKRTMLALVDSSQTTQRSLQRQLSLSENSSCTSCDLNSETSTDCTTPTSIGQMPEDLVFRRKQSIKRTYAFNELIDTERVYVTDLRVMVETYFNAMQKQSWITTEDLRIIARNIKDILEVHVRLLAKLEACSQNYHWENIHNRYCQLADVFVTMGPSFMVYAEFCGSHSKATKICANYQARPEWISFSKMCLLESDTATMNDEASSTASASTRLHLDDYLIKPIQRICRYQLLLKEILKSTDMASLEYEKLKHAYDIMQTIVTSVDERKNQRDLADRSQVFLDRLEDDWRLAKSFVSSLGNISMSGALEVTYAADRLSATKTRYMGCFLYSTYMIIVKAKKNSIYEAKHWFPINIFEVRDLPDTEGLSLSSFMLVSNGHMFEFSASCQQEKILWMKSLRSNILSSQLTIEEAMRTDGIGKSVPVSFYYKSSNSSFPLRTSKSQSSIAVATKKEDPDSTPIRRSRSITVQCSKSIDNLIFAAGYHSMSFGAKPIINPSRRSSVDQIFRSRSILKRSDDIESNYTIELFSTTPSPTESTVEHQDGGTFISGSTLLTVKRISQPRLAQQYSIKNAIDQKFLDVCTPDYLSSRAWYTRERNAGVTLKKRKSLPFIRPSSSAMSLSAVNVKRRTSDVGHSGRRNSLDKIMKVTPLDDYIAFQKSIVSQRTEAARRPSLTSQAIRNSWSKGSGSSRSKADAANIHKNRGNSGIADGEDEEDEDVVAPWEQTKPAVIGSEERNTYFQADLPKNAVLASEKLVLSPSKQCLGNLGIASGFAHNQERDPEITKSDGRRISQTLNFCKPKRAISAPPISPKTTRAQRSQRSTSLLVPKSINPVPLSEVPHPTMKRASLPPPLGRTIEISQPTSFAYSSTPPSTPKSAFFDSFKLKQILWWK